MVDGQRLAERESRRLAAQLLEVPSNRRVSLGHDGCGMVQHTRVDDNVDERPTAGIKRQPSAPMAVITGNAPDLSSTRAV